MIYGKLLVFFRFYQCNTDQKRAKWGPSHPQSNHQQDKILQVGRFLRYRRFDYFLYRISKTEAQTINIFIQKKTRHKGIIRISGPMRPGKRGTSRNGPRINVICTNGFQTNGTRTNKPQRNLPRTNEPHKNKRLRNEFLYTIFKIAQSHFF